MTSSIAPKLSVLLPVRDAATTIGVAVRSVLRSRGVRFGDDVELLVLDHASSDGTSAVLARLAGRPGVRVEAMPAEWSLPQVLEAGRKRCRAPLIARMDADDVMHPDRLASDLQWLLDRPGVDVVCCRTKIVARRDASHGLTAYVAWQNGVMSAEDHARELWVEQPLCHPAATFRARAVDDVGGYRDGAFAEDYDLFMRLASRGARIEKRPAVHHGWREHTGMSTRSDPRYHRDGFAHVKATAMIERFHVDKRPVFIAGGGKEGGRIGRVLLALGVQPYAYFDVAEKRVGRVRHGAPVIDSADLGAQKRAHPTAFCIGAVGTSGARGVVRGALTTAGFSEGHDFVMVA